MPDFRIEKGASGGGTPGGSDTQVQFNDAGAFGGDAGLTYNKTTNVLKITSGELNVPGAGATSEQFGTGAVASSDNATAVGNSALSSGGAGNTVAVGKSSTASASRSTSIGASCSVANTDSVGIGYSVNIAGSGTSSVAIGATAGATEDGAIAIGATASASGAGAIVLGSNAACTNANTFVAGSSTQPITDVFFSEGVTDATAVAFTLNGTGGSGTNNAGADLQLAGGRSTGSANGANITFFSSPAGGTGTTLRTLSKIATVKNNQGIDQALIGCIFTQTADKSVTNTVAETSIVGTGVGTLTLPARFFTVGKTIRITMSGVYSTVAVTGDTVTIKIKYGSTVLASKASTALVTGGTNLFWESEVLVTCRSTGASGTVQVSGGVRYQVAGAVVVEDELNNSVGTTTLDTTASGLFDITVTHSGADASNTVKSLVGAFEVLN